MKAFAAAIGAALAAALLAAPSAQAATTTTVTKSCAAGTFKGDLKVTYETSGDYHHPTSTVIASGPYIGDANRVTLRIFFVLHGETTTAYTRIWSGRIPAKITQAIPSDVALPTAATSYASASFSGGSGPCEARAEIK